MTGNETWTRGKISNKLVFFLQNLRNQMTDRTIGPEIQGFLSDRRSFYRTCPSVRRYFVFTATCTLHFLYLFYSTGTLHFLYVLVDDHSTAAVPIACGMEHEPAKAFYKGGDVIMTVMSGKILFIAYYIIQQKTELLLYDIKLFLYLLIRK